MSKKKHNDDSDPFGKPLISDAGANHDDGGGGVIMGKNATIGAGSVVTKSVDSHTLALSRAEMPTIPLRANSTHLTRCKKGTEDCSKMAKRGILAKDRIHMNSCGPELGARPLLEKVL
jgi:hypothetical protein